LSVLNSQDLVLTVTPSGVPEPSTWAMVLGGVGLLVFWKKKKEKDAVVMVKVS
jgi:hypothetical protein